MQIRIDSMVDMNETYETEISILNNKIQENEREKSKIANEY
jgi:hypothetical protein